MFNSYIKDYMLCLNDFGHPNFSVQAPSLIERGVNVFKSIEMSVYSCNIISHILDFKWPRGMMVVTLP